MRVCVVAVTVLGVALATATGAAANGGNARFSRRRDGRRRDLVLGDPLGPRRPFLRRGARAGPGPPPGDGACADSRSWPGARTTTPSSAGSGGLGPARRYWYRFRAGPRAQRSGARSSPRRARAANATVEFAWTGDTDFNRRPRPDAAVLERRRRVRAYERRAATTSTSTSATPCTPTARSRAPSADRADVPAKVGEVQGQPRQRARCGGCADPPASTRTGTTTSSSTTSRRPRTPSRAVTQTTSTAGSSTGAACGPSATTRRWPTRGATASTGRCAGDATSSSSSWTSARSAVAKADEGGVCDNPQTGEPDLAPTGPQSVRSVFAPWCPRWRSRCRQACLDAIREPGPHLPRAGDS